MWPEEDDQRGFRTAAALFCTPTSPANRHSRNSDFKFVLKSTEYFKGTFPLKANFVQQFLDFNCFEGNVGETSESRGGEHNYGLF